MTEFVLGDDTFKVYGTSDQPWFPAVSLEVYLELGNIRQNIHSVLDRDEYCKRMIPNARGKPTPQLLVSEGGLCKLIARSRKPIARVFDRWVIVNGVPVVHVFVLDVLQRVN